MSSNRALLRRNGTKNTTTAPPIPGRNGSIPSIQGAHGFQNAPGQGQVALRTNGQNQIAQRSSGGVQLRQEHRPTPQKQPPMTIERAITLLSLRMGIAEQTLQELNMANSSEPRSIGLNEDLAQNIMTRLDALEELVDSSASSAPSSSDLIVQHTDALKQFVNKSIKSIKTDLVALKQSIKSIEEMVHKNSAQIMILNMNNEMNNSDADADADADVDPEPDENDIDETFYTQGVTVEDEPDENDD